ncbi:MAG: Do family serine endopeptidase [Sulfurospirillum sp.]
MKKIMIFSLLLSGSLLMAGIQIESMPGNPQRKNATNKNVILSYNNAIKDMQKIVVNIASTKKIGINQNIQEMLNNPFLKEFFGNRLPKLQPQKRKAYSLGSGVIISQNGYIVTNNHVVDGADKIVVTIHGSKKEYKAKIIGQDPKTDIAVIKIDAKKLTVAKFGDSSKLLTGDIVFAIGNPFGVGESVTQGIVSALNKSSIGLNQYENFIQTDASINPGNSGGALVDTRGALIGINSAIISRSGGNNGIGFAIPSNMVKKIAVSLIDNGKIKRGYLGVSITDLKPDMKGLYKDNFGALILTVEKDSSAQKAGLKRGDLIIEVNGKKIKNANDLKNVVGSILPQKKITIKFERNKEIKTATAQLANMSSSKSFGGDLKENYIKGLTVTQINNQIRSKYQIPKDINGVLVTDVKLDSKADKIGFKRGDIIIQVQNKNISSIKDLNNVFKKYKNKIKMVYINRGGFVTYLVVK